MAAPDEAELARLSANFLLDELERLGTGYPCSSLTPLSGGSTNLVYRGILETPNSARDTVIFKFTAGVLAIDPSFEIDASRCLVESSMLVALENTSLPFSTPKVLFFVLESDAGVQVHEDFRDALNLSATLRSPTTSRDLATAIGYDLGFCLKSFHNLVASKLCNDPEFSLSPEMWINSPMRHMKHRTSYGSFIKLLDRFPGMTDDCKPLLEEVREMATSELELRPLNPKLQYWSMIHGDFCAGNVLLLSPPSPASPNKIAIIDWELAQYGHLAYDLGQFIGDLCENHLLDSPQNVNSTIGGFIRGYGGLSDELAFRTAIHAGVHFIHWYVRRPPTAEMLETPEKIADAMKLGRDIVVKGWKKDRAWFKGTILAPLFGF